MNPWQLTPKVYAGIGARKTPPSVLRLITRIAARLEANGWTLRTGGADGVDDAFNQGCEGDPELYLPWVGFNGWAGPAWAATSSPTPEAHELAAKHHPNWSRLTTAECRLHARNGHIVLGANLDSPAAFVLCWTPDGVVKETSARTGGTGQAIRIANAHDVPVFNLQREEHRAMWAEYVDGEVKA